MKQKGLIFSLGLVVCGVGLALLAVWLYLTGHLEFEGFASLFRALRAYPEVFEAALNLFFLTLILTLIPVALFLKKREKHQSNTTTHGSADWGRESDLKAQGLLSGEGVILGRTGTGKLISDNSDSHIFLCAPTRSGKGVGVVIPTLYRWQESVLVFDLKGENWRRTALERSKFSVPLYFNPRSKSTARYNPLLEIRKGKRELHDVRTIVEMLTDPTGKEKKDHWLRSARSLIEALILHVLYAEEDKSLGGVAKFFCSPEYSSDELLESMLKTPHLGDTPHPAVASVARAMLDKSENERSGVISTAREYMALYRDPVIAAALSESDFRLSDLMKGEYPVSLYLVVGPYDISTLAPLMRLLLSQFIQRSSEEDERKAHKLLLVLDEFPALGNLHFFESQLAYVAGYGIKALIIVQSMNQLYKLYGSNQSLIDNMKFRVFFAPNSIESAEVVSRMLGSKTEVHFSKSNSGRKTDLGLFNLSVSEQRHARALLTADEVMRTSKDEALLLIGNEKPCRIKKIYYFKDPEFKDRDTEELKIERSDRYPFRPTRQLSPWELMEPIVLTPTLETANEEELKEVLSGEVTSKRAVAF